MSALQSARLSPQPSATPSQLDPSCCFPLQWCVVYSDQSAGFSAHSVRKMWTHDVSRCHWKASDSHASGLCAAAYHHVPIPPGTGFPLFPFPVSPLTPTVSTNCERGTWNNKARQCHCWYSTMYSLQKIRHSGSLTATCSSLHKSPLRCCLISGLWVKKNQPKTNRLLMIVAQRVCKFHFLTLH